jgi:hypothetical protein
LDLAVRNGPILDARLVRDGKPVDIDGLGPVVPETDIGDEVLPAALPTDDIVGRYMPEEEDVD